MSRPPTRRSTASSPLRWLFCGLFALGHVAAVSPSAAQTTPAVLVVGAPADMHEAAVAAELQRLGVPAEEASRWATLLDFTFHGAEVWPAQTVARTCPSEHGEIALDGLLLEARAAVESWDYQLAEQTLAVVLGDLACFAVPISGPDLGRAALLLGYARYEDGNLDGAREAFRAAAAFDGDVSWDPELPPDAEKLFDAAASEQSQRTPARLEVDNKTRIRGVRIDGTIPPADNELSPGCHQLTVPGGDGSGVTLSIDIDPGETVELVPIDDLLRHLLNPRKSGGPAAHAMVDALAPGGRVDVLIADLSTSRLLRFDGAAGTVAEVAAAATLADGSAETSTVTLRTTTPKQTRRTTGLVLVAGGGAAALGGLVVNGATYQAGLRATEQVRYESLRSAGIAGIVVGAIGIAAGATGAVLLLTSGGGASTVAVIPGPVSTLEVRF